MQVRETSARIVRSIRRGFTLLEVLIVVAIIVMLAGVGAYFLLPQLEDAKVKVARAEMQGLAKQVDAYQIDHGAPSSIEDLASPPDGSTPLLPPEKTKDPWGKTYQVQVMQGAGKRTVVFTQTPDGKRISNLPGDQ